MPDDCHLGAGAPIREDYVQPQVRRNDDPEGDNSLSGFDRFGRVVDQLWEQYDEQELFSPLPLAGEGPGVRALDRYHYGYDSAGNRVWKMNAVAHDLSLPLDELSLRPFACG